MSEPVVSVLMCVYNGEDYLTDALESIVKQNFADWECVVVDDGSTDGTSVILDNYACQDRRFRIYHNNENLRLQASLNRGLSLVKGRYILRMDADDVSRSDRMSRQVSFMELHPEVDMASCRCLLWNNSIVVPGVDKRRTDSEAVRAQFLFSNPIVHPGVIFRRESLRGFEYDSACTCTEDLDLWVRMLCAGKKLSVQEEYLLLYRLHDKQVTATTAHQQREQYQGIIRRFYAEVMFELGTEELDVLTHSVYFKDYLNLPGVIAMYNRLMMENKARRIFDDDALRYAVAELLLEYRRAGMPVLVGLKELVHLGPGFWIRELPRRMCAARRDHAQRKKAFAAFMAEKVNLFGRKAL